MTYTCIFCVGAILKDGRERRKRETPSGIERKIREKDGEIEERSRFLLNKLHQR